MHERVVLVQATAIEVLRVARVRLALLLRVGQVMAQVVRVRVRVRLALLPQVRQATAHAVFLPLALQATALRVAPELM